MDAVFDPRQLPERDRLEANVGAQRRESGCAPSRTYHDLLLVYSQGPDYQWNNQYAPYEPVVRRSLLQLRRCRRRKALSARQPDGREAGRRHSSYEWKGSRPVQRTALGLLASEHGGVRSRRAVSSIQSVAAIPAIQAATWTRCRACRYRTYGLTSRRSMSQLVERLGYPTQKPLALLERIIAASIERGRRRARPVLRLRHRGPRRRTSSAGSGSASTSPISPSASSAAACRTPSPALAVNVVGEPVDVASARALFQQDAYQFQWWAVDKLGGAPQGGEPQEGCRQGHRRRHPVPRIGQRPTRADSRSSSRSRAAARASPTCATCKGVLEREKEPIGVLAHHCSRRRATCSPRRRRREAGTATWAARTYPRVQIVTVDEMFAGRRSRHAAADIGRSRKRSARPT